MKFQADLRVLFLLRFCVNIASIVVFVIGATALLGWILDVSILKSFVSGLPAMRFNTAMCLLLLGGSLWLLRNESSGVASRRTGQILAGLVLVISLLTISEYLLGWNLGIDELFFKDLESSSNLFPGRMSPIAALCCWLGSISLLMLGSRISQFFSLGVLFLSLAGVMNYLFDLQVFFRNPEYTYVTVHTSAALLIFSFAIFAARPPGGLMRILSSDLPGSRAMRILLPAMVILNILMAWLVEWIESVGGLDTSRESIFLVILLIFVYSPLIYFVAGNINQVEEKLLVSDQILERVNALVLVANAQGSITYVSPSVKTILGFEPEELLGEGWWKTSRSSPEAGGAEREHILSSSNQNSPINPEPYEREILDRWGNKHWLIWMDALGPDASVIGVGHDITERKHAEQKLIENESRYRQAIMAANAIPYSLDYATNQYTFIGAGIAELTGIPLKEFTPALLDSLIQESTMMGEFKGVSLEKAVELVRLGGSGLLWQCDHRIHTRSGEERWISDASIQVLGDNGIPKGSIGIFQDITERKHSEQALRESERELRVLSEALEQRVVERTADLHRVNAELEKAASAKDEFLAVMSHELRTPLTSILGMSESLMEQTRGPINERQEKSLQIIQSSGRHLLELINDILDLSKIEAGKLELHPESVGVSALCEASLAFVLEQAKRKSISLEFYPERAQYKLVGDPRYLKQVLVNLLNNAVKFTPEKGRVVLNVTADAEKELMQFSVIDNGIGIAPENLSRLFQPFVQVDSRLSRHYEGTGLGLALVQKLTDLHGGSVYVESEANVGSRFTINLPWRSDTLAPETAVQQVAIATREPGGTNEALLKGSAYLGLVLLAEDNLANILTIVEYLEGKNFQVVVAHDGLEAIARASETNPDIILMDIQMPSMDGLEATQRLRADDRFKSTPIIALTALAMPGDRERCLRAGASEYLSKPVSLRQLVEMINDLIR